MLERLGLFLGPPRPPADRPGRCRGPAWSGDIYDLKTHNYLGLARERGPRAWTPARWLARGAWEVCEAEDESLLLSLYGPWGWFLPWEVRDAEGRLVASVAATLLLDCEGDVRARLEPGPDPACHLFVGEGGGGLGSLRRAGGGLELRFAPAVADDPYTKIALLGAAVALGRRLPRPGRP